MHDSRFIHCTTGGCLGCLQFGAIQCSCAYSWWYILVHMYIFSSWVKFGIILEKTPNSFSKYIYQFVLSPTVWELWMLTNTWLCQSVLDNKPFQSLVAWNRKRVIFHNSVGRLASAGQFLCFVCWGLGWFMWLHSPGSLVGISKMTSFAHLVLWQRWLKQLGAGSSSLHMVSCHPVSQPRLIYMAAGFQECKNRSCKSS